jgi:uncharacterized protein YjbJ (UPF0337 family)
MGEMIDKTKGKLKQAVGAVTGDRALVQEGQNDEDKGKLEGVANGVKQAAHEVKEAVKEALK